MERKKAANKDYRKQSPQYFLIGLVIALSTTLLAFEWKTYQEIPIELPDETYDLDLGEELEKVVFVAKKLPPPPKPETSIAPPTPEPVVIFVVEPIVVAIDTADTPPDFPDEKVVIEAHPKPTRFPEKYPEFVGGEEAMYKYLSENLTYPKDALRFGLEAKLYVQFVIDVDGGISDVEVLRPQGYGFDSAAFKVISEMPKWKPGKKGGQNVRVLYVIPINFALN